MDKCHCKKKLYVSVGENGSIGAQMNNTGLFSPIPIPIQYSSPSQQYQYNPNHWGSLASFGWGFGYQQRKKDFGIFQVHTTCQTCNLLTFSEAVLLFKTKALKKE
jgi:hypothetical protein